MPIFSRKVHPTLSLSLFTSDALPDNMSWCPVTCATCRDIKVFWLAAGHRTWLMLLGFFLSIATTLKITGRTKSHQYSSLPTVCTWRSWLMTGQCHLMICLNMSWWTCLWAERFQTDVMCFVELFGSGSQERKGWWCRPKRTETLMDSAASTIHKGEWSPQGKSVSSDWWF